MSQRFTTRWIAGGLSLAIGLSLNLALSGCETMPAPGPEASYEAYRNEGVRPAFNVTFNYSDGVVVDNAFVASQYYEGTARAGRAEVAFQAGLKEQAGALAVEIEQHIAHVEQALGRDYPLPVRAYLLRRDRMPGTIAGSFQKTSEVFQFPLFAVDGEESFETIRSTNPFYPYMFVHELTKLSLVDPARPPLVLADQKSNPLVKIEYNTRWFREGLANYAEYLVYERLRARAEAEGDPLALSTFESSHVYQKPLSALAELGPAVFDWTAFGDAAEDSDYFNASLGLFMLVEDQFGEGAVRRVLDELETAEYVDGTVIETAFNRALNTDIRQLANDFALPAPGAETSTLTPATAKNYGLRAGSGLYVNNVTEGGLAQAAGLQRGDVIVQINRRPVANTLDAEIAMLEAKRHGNVYFTIDRMGERQTLGARFNVPAAPGTGQSGVGPGLVTGDVLGFSGTE